MYVYIGEEERGNCDIRVKPVWSDLVGNRAIFKGTQGSWIMEHCRTLKGYTVLMEAAPLFPLLHTHYLICIARLFVRNLIPDVVPEHTHTSWCLALSLFVHPLILLTWQHAMYLIAGSTERGVYLISMQLFWLVNTAFLVLKSQDG